jgi:hypothetical protein
MTRAEPNDASAFAVDTFYYLRVIALYATPKKVVGLASKAKSHRTLHMVAGHSPPELCFVRTVRKQYLVSGGHRLPSHAFAE